MLYWDVKTVTSEGDWKKSRQGLLNTMMQVEIAVPGLQIVGSSMNATRKLQVVAPALCLFFCEHLQEPGRKAEASTGHGRTAQPQQNHNWNTGILVLL